MGAVRKNPIILVLVLALLAYVGLRMASSGDVDPVFLQEYETALENGPEARRWLGENKHPFGFASNRFRSTHLALQFVEALYDAGAEKVVVRQKSIRPEPEHGGDYADALIVRLPAAPEARERVLDIARQEARRDGIELGPETQHGVLFLWWD